MSMPRFGEIGLVGQPHLAAAAAEQRAEHLAEVVVDGVEGFLEALARFRRRFPGSPSRCRGWNRAGPAAACSGSRSAAALPGIPPAPADSPDPAPRCAPSLPGTSLRLRPARLRRARSPSPAASSSSARVQLLAAGLVQILQLGLLLHQLQFDLRRASPAQPAHRCAELFSDSSDAASAARSFVSCCRQTARPLRPTARSAPTSCAGALDPARCCRPAGGRVPPQALQSRGQLLLARDQLADLVLEPRLRRPSRRGAALRIRPDRRAARRALRPPGAALLPAIRQLARAHPSSACFLGEARCSFSSTSWTLRSCCSAERVGLLARAAPVPGAPPTAATCPGELLGQLALLVIQRQRVLLLGLLLAAQPLQIFRQAARSPSSMPSSSVGRSASTSRCARF